MRWDARVVQLSMAPARRVFRAITRKVTYPRYRELLSAAVGMLLDLHPDLDRVEARRRAAAATGATPPTDLLPHPEPQRSDRAAAATRPTAPTPPPKLVKAYTPMSSSGSRPLSPAVAAALEETERSQAPAKTTAARGAATATGRKKTAAARTKKKTTAKKTSSKKKKTTARKRTAKTGKTAKTTRTAKKATPRKSSSRDAA